MRYFLFVSEFSSRKYFRYPLSAVHLFCILLSFRALVFYSSCCQCCCCWCDCVRSCPVLASSACSCFCLLLYTCTCLLTAIATVPATVAFGRYSDAPIMFRCFGRNLSVWVHWSGDAQRIHWSPAILPSGNTLELSEVATWNVERCYHPSVCSWHHFRIFPGM